METGAEKVRRQRTSLNGSTEPQTLKFPAHEWVRATQRGDCDD